MTKKELLEAIKDMPMDAEIGIIYILYDGTKTPLTDIEYNEKYNEILLC